MTTIEQLKSAVKASIKPNGRQEITGSVLQETLIKIIDAVYSAIPDVVNDLVSGGSAKSLSAEQGKLLKTAIDDVLRSLENKQDKLNFDNTPVADSDNPVTSDGIFKAIQSVLTSLSETMNSDYQKKSDEALDTKAKEVVPAINELANKADEMTDYVKDIVSHFDPRAVAEALVSLAARLDAIESSKGLLGNATAGVLDVSEITRDRYPLVLCAHGVPAEANIPENLPKGLPWDGLPAFKGQQYIDLDASSGGLYYATGNESINDWKQA